MNSLFGWLDSLDLLENGKDDDVEARSLSSNRGMRTLSDQQEQSSREFRSQLESHTAERRTYDPHEKSAYAQRCDELRKLQCDKPESVQAYMTWRLRNGCKHFLGYSRSTVEDGGSTITHELDLYHNLHALIDSSKSHAKVVVFHRSFRDEELATNKGGEFSGEAAFRLICRIIAIPMSNSARASIRRLRITIRDEQSGPMLVKAVSSLTSGGTVLESIDIHGGTTGATLRNWDASNRLGTPDFGILPQNGAKLVDALCMQLTVNAQETSLQALRISTIGMVGWGCLVPFLPAFAKLQELSTRGLASSVDMDDLTNSLLKNSSLTNVVISCLPGAAVFSKRKTMRLDSYIQRNRNLLLTLSRLQSNNDESKETTTETCCVPYLFRAAMQTPQAAAKLILMGLLTAGPTAGPAIIP